MIFDGSIEIAKAAAERWSRREQERKQREGLRSVEIETPERVQKRLDRLQQVTLRQAVMSPGEVELHEIDGRNLGLERTIGDRDFLGIAFVEHALAVSRFVGRVLIRSAPAVNVGFGTGFMVSPRLLLTNNHVLPNETLATHSEVEFDFQRDRFNRMMTSVYFKLEPSAFFLTSRDLDFTLVAVAERSRDGTALNPYGWSRLIAAEGKALIGDPLNIIQHPRGEHKQIVVRSNKLVDLLDHFAHYTTDTEPGSSGSPVYNDQWEVVALHHSGVPKRDDQGRLVKRDGSPWDEDVDSPDELVWVANEGIRVSTIVRQIEQANLPSGWAPLRQELLERDPPDPMEAARAALRDQAAVRAASGIGKTVTIPLRITVSLGDPDGHGLSDAEAPAGRGSDGSAVSRTRPDAAPPLPAEARHALSELEEAAQRPYYDAEADGRDRDAYWAELSGGQLSPTEMFAAIHGLLARTHVNTLRYKPGLHVYPWVDLHPGTPAVVRSIYSGQSFDPAELIREDFRIEAAFEQAAERLSASLEGLQKESALDALEAQLPYNCEHVVPQSWFLKKEPMRGDLHHLFTCESRCNSFRGNTPYFDFADFEEVILSDCGKREGERFEPSAGKGPAARATLYFLLRYPDEIERLPEQYDEARIQTLVAWHKASPPGDYERHRNAAIREKQGNRNPLIDFPDWVDRIAFTEGLG